MLGQALVKEDKKSQSPLLLKKRRQERQEKKMEGKRIGKLSS
jgi:hypothetical protein